MLGGGARNALLNQWLANALMQLVGLGEVNSLGEVRAIARNALTQLFSPRTAQFAEWREAAQRFSAMTAMDDH